jgi:hypothetical protein
MFDKHRKIKNQQRKGHFGGPTFDKHRATRSYLNISIAAFSNRFCPRNYDCTAAEDSGPHAATSAHMALSPQKKMVKTLCVFVSVLC